MCRYEGNVLESFVETCGWSSGISVLSFLKVLLILGMAFSGGVSHLLPLKMTMAFQVGDGQAALDYLASGRFDLLVLDLGLPKKKGMEVLTELRAMPPESSIRDIPVIVSSGHVLDEQRRLCLEAG